MAFETGPIGMQALAAYYGKSLPVSLSDLYRGIPDVYNTTQNAGIPTSGTIGFEEFRTSDNYPFNISTLMASAEALVNIVPVNLLMPPFSSSDHFAQFYWSGGGWVLYAQDSWGGGDTWFNTMANILPSFFSLFTTMSGGGVIPYGAPSSADIINSLSVGTLYTASEGYSVRGPQGDISSYGYGTGQSDVLTFNYLNAVIHQMSGAFGSLQSVLNGISFAGSRAGFLAGMQAYVNYLYST